MKNQIWHIQDARKILKEEWDSSWLRGRCWGIKTGFPENPVAGSNITLMEGDTVVTISESKSGVLVIHEFKRSIKTDLGNRIFEKLCAAGKPCVKEYPGIPGVSKRELPDGDHIWQCLACGDMSGFNLEGIDCPDPIFNKVSQEIQDHRKDSPNCASGPSIRILIKRDGRVEIDEAATQLFQLRL